MSSLSRLILLCGAGALGTLARYAAYLLSARLFGERLPIGTVVVNLLGSFLFGVGWAFAERMTRGGPEVRLLALTGFMGAFTTFSTFASDIARLVQAGRWGLAIGDLVVQNGGGVAAIVLGWYVVRLGFG